MQKFQPTLYLCLILSAFFSFITSKNGLKPKLDYKFKLTNVVCHDDNDYIVNLTCFIKAGRDKAGFLTIKSFIRKPMANFIVEVRHFYKPVYGRNPQYRPYVINLDVDWCDLMGNSRGRNVLVTSFLDFLRFAFDSKEVFKKCPLQGKWASENVDLDQLYGLGEKYGQGLPEGDHKFTGRFRSKTNYTFETIVMVLNIKGQRGVDLSMLSMG